MFTFCLVDGPIISRGGGEGGVGAYDRQFTVVPYNREDKTKPKKLSV